MGDPYATNPQPGNYVTAGIAGTAHWSETPTPVLSYSFADGSLSDHNFINSNWVSAGSYLPSSANRLNLETGTGNLAAMRDEIHFAFDTFENVANIVFNENTSFQLTGVDLKIAAYNNAGYNGVATFPGTDQMTGTTAPTNDYESFIIYNNNSSSMSTTPELGGSSNRLHTVIHEIGHALGLGHPHDTGTGSNNITGGSAFTYVGDNEIDNDRYTVMSYERGGLNQNSQSRTYGYAVTPMALDIAAMQYLYGSVTNNTGNTTYELTDIATTARDLDGSDGTVSIGRAFFGIWDTGGTDEITYSGSDHVLINLNEATLNQTSDPANIIDIINTLNGSSLFDTILPTATAGELRDDLLDKEFHAGGFFSRIFSDTGAPDLGGYSIANDLYADTGHTTIIENASGSVKSDLLIGNEQNNVLDGNGGNDLLLGGEGNDTLNGGSGDDELYGMDDNDSLSGSSGNDTLFGGAGADTLNGGLDEDVIEGGGGNDLLVSSSGNYWDDVDGGSGNDTLDHSASSYSGNTLDFDTGVGTGFGFGTDNTASLASIEEYRDGSGGNTVYSDGAMTYYGNGGADTYYERTSGGTDIVDMGTDDDMLYIRNTGIGGDVWNGGAGIDTVDFSALTYSSGTQIDLTAGAILSASGASSEDLLNFENVIGSQGGDLITGNLSANVIDGQGGNDTIDGVGAGNDIDGGDGDDLIYDSSSSSDTFEGGAGTDTLVSDNVWVDNNLFDMMLGQRIYASTTYDLFTGFENITVGGGSDVIGDGGDNHIVALDNSATYQNNTFSGGDGNDTLEGGLGDDMLDGGSGTDSLLGGDGNDTLSQGFGGPDETLDGGAGTDTADWSYNLSDDWVIDLGAGTANIGATTYAQLISIENVVGGGANDLITGASGGNMLDGGAGNDTLDGGLGVDTILGGAGDDLMYMRSGDGIDHYDGGTGTDTVDFTNTFINTFVDLLNETWSFSSTLGGNDMIDVENIITFDGNDTVIGSAADNDISTKGGNDSVDGGDGDDKIFGGDGDDTILGGDGSDTLGGGTDNDLIDGGAWADTINGGSGDDTLLGGGGGDQIDGGYGNDSINGGGGDDFIDGGTWADTLIGARGADTLLGGGGGDFLDAGGSDDSVDGGGGNDTIDSGAGADTMDGGSGIDLLSYADSALAVDVNLTGGTASGGHADGDVISNIENLEGSLFDDALKGDANNNWLGGLDGNDTLTGLDGDDTLLGGSGSDSMLGGSGDDSIDGGDYADTLGGGAGNDTLIGGGGGDDLNGGDWADTLNGGGGADTIAGGGGGDFINGGDGGDDIIGAGGNDTVYGGGGNDDISGGNSGDLLYGEDGNDTIGGGGGNDTISGGAGNDLLTGGNGSADQFVFVDGDGNDTIADFNANDGEDIDLSGVSAITDFTDLVTNHLSTSGGFALIDYGTGTILLDGITVSQIGVGLDYSADDFIF